ncbi:MAG: hypothetical protein NVSMB25_07760 [Thermoleophilaceae bacterium]
MSAEPTGDLTATQATAERAAANTIARAVGEIVGKLASLVLFAALARKVGEAELGIFVFAFAWTQVATTPAGIGFDRYLLRKVAEDRQNAQALFYEIVRTKVLRSLPLAALSFLLLWILGYSSETRDAVYLLTVGLTIDNIARSLFMVFTGVERVGTMAVTLVVQRVSAAVLGIGALLLGYGVVAVALTYTVGAAAGLLFASVVMARSMRIKLARLPPPQRRVVRRDSRPYAAQDVVGILLAKIDTVILSFLATSAAVGRYGAAYRLLESTFFLTFAVTGAFAAMFTYLRHDSEPTIGAAYERSLKLTIILLMPCAIAFGILARPISRAFFGPQLADAAHAVTFLAPVVLLLGIIQLAMTLITGRRDAVIVVRITVLAVAVNIALNLILIPILHDRGAAIAMLVTAVVFVVALASAVKGTIGKINWRAAALSPIVAGAAMVAPLVVLRGSLLAATLAGTAIYAAVLLIVELARDPVDVRFVASMLRRRLPERFAS